MDDVILNKIETIERRIRRMEEEGAKNWKENFTYQDALLINIVRACQCTIDIAAHIIGIQKLGIPKRSTDVFAILEEKGVIGEELATKMKKMVSFRNIAVHDYAKLNLDVVAYFVEKGTLDFKSFARVVISQQNTDG